MNFTILGAGGWGIALSLCAFGCGHQVCVWSPFEEEIEMLCTQHEHKKLLPGVAIPTQVSLTTDIGCAADADVVIIAVPSLAVRQTAKRLAQAREAGIVVNVAKGLEKGSLLRLSQVVCQELPQARIVVLSGPSHAEEVAGGVPTSLVSASEDAAAAETVQNALMSKTLRIYTNEDIVGVELGGALKNIIAVAAGVSDGLGLGDNTRAALITRGLTEIARLGAALGAKEKTFAGLSGVGDLIVTCTSRHSRNHRFGEMVGRGTPVDQALSAVGTVEGYHTTDMAYALSQAYRVEMPITQECYRMLYQGSPPRQALTNLMQRRKKNEHENAWL